MKTSKVKAVNQVKPWNGSNGTVFYCQCEMENGDKIEIGKKKEVQLGWDLTYEIVDTSQEYNKAKAVQPESGGFTPNASFTPRPQNNDNLKGVKVGHALTNAVSLYVAIGGNGQERPEAIKTYAKEIYMLSEQLNNEL